MPRIELEKYIGLVVSDRNRPGVVLHHMIAADPATGEYEQWDHHKDGSMRIQKDGTVKVIKSKGALFFDRRQCAVDDIPGLP
jgi:hypothetical protein